MAVSFGSMRIGCVVPILLSLLSVGSAVEGKGPASAHVLATDKKAAEAPAAAKSLMRREEKENENPTDGAGLLETAASSSEKSNATTPYRIFTYWDYPKGPSVFVQMNVDSWKRHAPAGTEIIFINETNIRDWVPDLPGEFFRLPYPAARSDFIRSWVLYHNGGLYMDTDFLVTGPLQPVYDTLDKGWDVVVYTDAGEESGECNGIEAFSSNFMAARAHNPFSGTWRDNMKFKLTRLCGEGEYGIEKVCCHEAFAKTPERRSCHVPWGHLEWLKDPRHDPDGSRHHNAQKEAQMSQLFKLRDGRNTAEEQAILAKVDHGNRAAKQIPAGTHRYCLRGVDKLAPHLNGEVYWQPWNTKARTTQSELVELSSGKKDKGFDTRFACKELDGTDLDCDRGNWGQRPRFFPQFFNRFAYHLFFSTFEGQAATKEEVLEHPWLLSELYRRSFANTVQSQFKVPGPPSKDQVTV